MGDPDLTEWVFQRVKVSSLFFKVCIEVTWAPGVKCQKFAVLILAQIFNSLGKKGQNHHPTLWYSAFHDDFMRETREARFLVKVVVAPSKSWFEIQHCSSLFTGSWGPSSVLVDTMERGGKKKLCAHPNCSRWRLYGYALGPPTMCSEHKIDGMINRTRPMCLSTDADGTACSHFAYFCPPGSSRPEFCRTHAPHSYERKDIRKRKGESKYKQAAHESLGSWKRKKPNVRLVFFFLVD